MASTAQHVEEGLHPYRERILAAAVDQLLEFGLARTSLDRIAAAGGVSRATLFKRFSSRDRLLRTVAARELGRFTTEIEAAVAEAGTPEERIVAAVVGAAHALREQRLFRRLIETDPEQMLPLLTTGIQPMLDEGRRFLAEVIARAAEDGLPLASEPEVLAELLVRIAHSLLLAPESKLPVADEQLAALARTHIAPLVCRARC